MSGRWGDLGRELAFRVRSRFTLSAPMLARRRASSFDVEAALDGALTGLPQEAAERLHELRATHDLARMARAYSRRELREGLYVLDVYARILQPLAPAGPGLDVGAKNGAHLPALATAVPGEWHGVELDGRRRYFNGVTRERYARQLTREFPECSYAVGSVVNERRQYGVIHWVLPFVRIGALESWGLPRRFFEPAALLRHVWSLVRPGGVLFIVNQGEEEAAAQRALFQTLGIPGRDLGALESAFSPFRMPRFAWLVERARDAPPSLGASRPP